MRRRWGVGCVLDSRLEAANPSERPRLALFFPGVDEAGRGPLAGPVVAAACVISPHVDIPGVADSKIMTEEQREAAFQLLTTTPGVVWATCVWKGSWIQRSGPLEQRETRASRLCSCRCVIGEKEIDTINILQAALKAMVGATEALPSKADYVLVDGNHLPKVWLRL